MSNKNPYIDMQTALNAVLRRSFEDFVRKAHIDLFPTLEYREPKHLALLCAVLFKLFNRETRRQIINTPPRAFKSFIATVCFSAWYLGRFPGTKIMIVSHDKSVSGGLADQIRSITQSDWYCRAFDTRLRPDFDRQMHFQTTVGGGVLATSIDGQITGHGADIIIFDDPLDAGHASSGLERRKVNELFDRKFITRLNNQSEGLVLVVHQRLHPEDLSGYLHARGGYEALTLPLVATEDVIYEVGNVRWERPEGDILDPTNNTAESVADLQRRPYIYASHYQQKPILGNGDLLKRAWFPIVDTVPAECSTTILSFDCAQSSGENSSFSCCLVFRTNGIDHYLCESSRIKGDYGETKKWAEKLLEKYPTATVLMEKAAFGDALSSELSTPARAIIPVPRPTKSKEDRTSPHMDILYAGRVKLVRPGIWHEDFLDEIAMFPRGNYDDQVDCLTQYLDFKLTPPPKHLTRGVSLDPFEPKIKTSGKGTLRSGSHEHRNPNVLLRKRPFRP